MLNGRKVGRLFSRYFAGPVFIISLTVLLAAAACGGGGTTTPTPAPTATPDPAAAYKASATNLATTLGTQADTALKDMQSAQLTQTDPKWATVLTTDADLVTASAAQLKALNSPGGALAATAASLSAAADRLAQGAQFLKQSVQAADPVAGAQAFAALTEGRGMLSAAAAGLK